MCVFMCTAYKTFLVQAWPTSPNLDTSKSLNPKISTCSNNTLQQMLVPAAEAQATSSALNQKTCDICAGFEELCIIVGFWGTCKNLAGPCSRHGAAQPSAQLLHAGLQAALAQSPRQTSGPSGPEIVVSFWPWIELLLGDSARLSGETYSFLLSYCARSQHVFHGRPCQVINFLVSLERRSFSCLAHEC